MKRYQVYLNPQSINILDQAGDIVPLGRSRLLREAADAAANRVGNLLGMFKPAKSSDYKWLDAMIGAVRIKGKKTVNISENVDELYYR